MSIEATRTSIPSVSHRTRPVLVLGLVVTAAVFVVLDSKDDVQYGVNLDVTSYTNGKRDTHNPPGRALPFTVWDFYSVRRQGPQVPSAEDLMCCSVITYWCEFGVDVPPPLRNSGLGVSTIIQLDVRASTVTQLNGRVSTVIQLYVRVSTSNKLLVFLQFGSVSDIIE